MKLSLLKLLLAFGGLAAVSGREADVRLREETEDLGHDDSEFWERFLGRYYKKTPRPTDPSFPPPKMAVWAENFPEWMGSLAPAECTLEKQPDSLEGFRETLIRFGVL